jgi:hypothetical protein
MRHCLVIIVSILLIGIVNAAPCLAQESQSQSLDALRQRSVEAHRAYELAKQQLLARVKQTDEYEQANDNLRFAEGILTDPGSTPEMRINAAKDKMEATNRIQEITNRALVSGLASNIKKEIDADNAYQNVIDEAQNKISFGVTFVSVAQLKDTQLPNQAGWRYILLNSLSDQNSGVVVTEVTSNSGMAEAGIEVGDIITGIDDQQINNIDDFVEWTAKVIRDNKYNISVMRSVQFTTTNDVDNATFTSVTISPAPAANGAGFRPQGDTETTVQHHIETIKTNHLKWHQRTIVFTALASESVLRAERANTLNEYLKWKTDQIEKYNQWKANQLAMHDQWKNGQNAQQDRCPFELKGDMLGMPLDAFKAEYPRFVEHINKPRIDAGIIDVENGLPAETIADVPAQITYSFVDRKLYQIAVSFKHDDYDQVMDGMRTKYGDAPVVGTDTFQNMLGAIFKGGSMTWSNAVSSITILELAKSLDQSFMIMKDQELDKIATDRLNQKYKDDL